MAALLLTALTALSSLPSTSAARTTWGSVIFTMYGEHTPVLTSGTPSLTPLGAQQALASGNTLRTRYISGTGNNITSSYPIAGISQSLLDNSQLYMLSTNQPWVVSSAQAFMQGLYPPIGALHVDSQSMLANGTLIQYPLNGYQYPSIEAISASDFNYVW